jgi:mono/diheme cytochrome c family protein
MKKALIATVVLAIATPMFAADGAALYKAKCAMCHGPDASKNAPNLAKLSEKEIAAVTTKGQGKMPAYEGKLSAEEITAVAAAMKSLKK